MSLKMMKMSLPLGKRILLFILHMRGAVKLLLSGEHEIAPPDIPIAVWRNEMTIWARKMGYAGPFPELED